MFKPVCQIEEYVEGSARAQRPDDPPVFSIYDPAGVMAGAEWKQCMKPAVATGKIGEYLCQEHSIGYTESKEVKPIGD